MMEPQASLLVPGGKENMATVDGNRGSLADDDLYASTNQSQPDDTPTPSTSQSRPSDSVYPSTSQSQDGDNPCPSTSQSCDSGKFSIKTSLIPQASNQGDELSGLGINVYNQEDLEQGIMAQVDQAMAKDEEERIKKLIERQLSSVLDDIRSTREELERIGRVIRSVISSNKGEISKEAKKHLEAAKRQRENKLKQMKKLKAKRGALLSKLDGQEMDAEAVNDDEDLQFFDQALSSGAAVLTEGERLIKLGEMTPFGTIVKSQESKTSAVKPPPKPHVLSDFEMFLQNKDSSQTSKKTKSIKSKNVTSKKSAHVTASHETEARASEKLPKPNRFDEKDNKVYNRERDFSKLKGKRSYPKLEHNFSEDPELSEPSGGSEDEWTPGSEDEGGCLPRGGPSPAKKPRGKLSTTGSTSGKDQLGLINGKHQLEKDAHLKRARDDGNFAYFQKRLKAYRKSEAARKKQQQEARLSDSEDEETEFEGGLKVPGSLWKRLFGYQRTGVKWLWELHCQQAGGIVGDEMGLGKTIQTIAFLASLKTSKIRQRPFRYMGLGPTIIVCPATVMHQWVREFHKWWPEFRVAILHSSGSFTGTEESLIHNIVNQHGVLITSYSSLVGHQDSLLQHDWHYIFLDEGHKIRNPDAQATLACKQFRTPHRIILSGSPIQNNLKELWSLFDFVFPGKLGTLPDFMAHFSVPIVQGGYANATQVQVQTAYKCACILRDTIGPYLLRRMKADVKSAVKLPGKSEQVLFCRLTDEQRDVYQEYLDSKECNAILAGKYKVFAGLITLRKICNHPDISTGGPRVLVGQSTDGDESLEYGYWRRSGKLIVVESLLKLWKKQGQRVLLFSQSKQMLDILERFVNSSGYSYLRMDGGTTISSRQPLIHKFNSNPNIFLFLLTTRVGGLGVNLTGANRVVIFDPDWNPSTDMQARERAWRIGQHRQVTIYRLLTTGTIEEKIYHRQIFKQFLTNRVLKDPKQRRFFKTNDLYELFTLGNKDDQNGTETGAIFAGIGSEVTLGKRQNRFDAMKEEALPVKRPALRQSKSTSALALDTKSEVSASGETKAINGMASIPKIPKKAPSVLDRQEQLREMARKLSEKIGHKTDVTDTTATVDSKNCRKDREQKKKKKKKRVKDAEFEGEKIPHLAKLRDYQQSGQKTEESPENLSAQQDDYVLKRLFKKTGIQGALKHDVIVGASKTDYALVEGEAERVAREAAAALKRSRVSCRNALSGIPTWTGQHGQGGAPARPKFGRKKNSLIAERKTSDLNAPTPVPKNGGKDGPDSPKAFDGTQAGNRTGVGLHTSSKQMVMSSRELLQRMKARNIVSESRQSVEQEEEEQGGTTPAPPTGDNKDIDLITDIRNFIAFQCHMDGQASTQELLDEFGIKLPPGDSAKFKAMLRQICDFDRSSDVGIWRLKPVYR